MCVSDAIFRNNGHARESWTQHTYVLSQPTLCRRSTAKNSDTVHARNVACLQNTISSVIIVTYTVLVKYAEFEFSAASFCYREVIYICITEAMHDCAHAVERGL